MGEKETCLDDTCLWHTSVPKEGGCTKGLLRDNQQEKCEYYKSNECTE